VDLRKIPVSGIVLVASNLLSIILAVAERVDLGAVVWAYWIESVMVGFFTILALFLIGVRSKEIPGFLASAMSAGFFAFHYGMFHFVYLIFLSALPWFAVDPAWYLWIMLTAGILFLSHSFSFLANVLFAKEPAGLNDLNKTMMAPYSRIIPLHMTIILSGFVVAFVPVGDVLLRTAILMLFMGLKTAADFGAHVKAHGE